MKPKSVIVIGAGIGGLTAAIHLARRGEQTMKLNAERTTPGAQDRLAGGYEPSSYHGNPELQRG